MRYIFSAGSVAAQHPKLTGGIVVQHPKWVCSPNVQEAKSLTSGWWKNGVLDFSTQSRVEWLLLNSQAPQVVRDITNLKVVTGLPSTQYRPFKFLHVEEANDF